jgi:hypothetical protein
MGCLKENDRVHEYIIPEKYDQWQECRKECSNRRMKVGNFDFNSLIKSQVSHRLQFIPQQLVNVDVFKLHLN